MRTYQTYNLKYYPRTRTATPFILNSQFSIFNFTSNSFPPFTPFTSCTPCPHFTPSFPLGFHIPHYRNLFNSQEADNEVYESGAVLGYEFRQYDARTGRWWSIDPKANEYLRVSPYAFCNGNPIALMDPSGEKIKPINETSKQYMNSYIQDQFGTSDFVRYSNKNIVKINREDFRTLYSKANAYQRVLLTGLKKVVNSKSMVYVDIDNKKEFKFSYPYYKESNDSEFPVYSHDIIGRQIVESGATVEASDGYHIYINNEGAIADKMISSISFKDFNLSVSYTGGSASAVFFHELLDEVLNYYIKHKVNDRSLQQEKVFYENKALENKGLEPRNGIDHE